MFRSEKISRDFCHTGGGSRYRSSCGAGQKCVAEYHYKQMMLTCDDGSRRPFDVKFTTGCNCKAESRRKPPFFWKATFLKSLLSSDSALNCHIFFIPLNYQPLFNSFKKKLWKTVSPLTPDRLLFEKETTSEPHNFLSFLSRNIVLQLLCK